MKFYDLHTHTTHSDGDATVQQLLDAAEARGCGLGVSDHLLCCGMETLEAVTAYLDELERYPVLKGCEANVGEDYRLPDAIANRLDYVIASVHEVSDLAGGSIHLGVYFGERAGDDVVWERNIDESRSREYLETVLPVVERTMSTQRMDIYGHCTVLPFCEILAGTSYLEDWENELISLCLKYNVAMEISGLWKEPGLAMIRRAAKRGVKFSLGSDCHLLKDACNIDYPIRMVEEAGLTEDQLWIPNPGK